MKLQHYEKKFVQELKSRFTECPEEDINMLLKIWRRKFSGRTDRSSAIRIPADFLGTAEFFKQNSYTSIFIQDGRYLENWEELDYKKTFLNIRSSCFTSNFGAPIYLLYGYTPTPETISNT